MYGAAPSYMGNMWAILNVGFFGRILPNVDQKPLLRSYKNSRPPRESLGLFLT